MMFPYSPSYAAHLLFGGYSNNSSSSATAQNDAKKRTELVKFMDIADYFFISHPASGQKEGFEQERLMFFSPSTESVGKQTEITGMAEAIVTFSACPQFGESQEEETVDNKKQKEECEYRYVTSASSKEIILVVEGGNFIIGTSLSRRLCKEHDYHPHPGTIRAVLERAYQAYRLFYGPLGMLFCSSERQLFKTNLERFFSPYLQLLRLHKTPLVDLFSGVDFLPLESLNFLEVHCLMTNCMEEFPCIKKTMFLYQDRLIQYSVQKRDLVPLWHFLNQTLIPSAMQAELSPPSAAGRRASQQQGGGDGGRTGFLVDGSLIVDFLGELSLQQFPRVFISEEAEEEGGTTSTAHDLIAYRVLNATACFFVPSNGPEEAQLSATFLDHLAAHIDSQMGEIASKIGDKFLISVRPFPGDVLPHQFVYFNPDSLSLKKSFATNTSGAAAAMMASLSMGGGQNGGNGGAGTAEAQILPSSIHKLIFETYDKFMSDSSSSLLGQIHVKADNDWWIVFKRVERRILALFLQQTSATTIVDVQNAVDSIVRCRFPNLFIS